MYSENGFDRKDDYLGPLLALKEEGECVMSFSRM